MLESVENEFNISEEKKMNYKAVENSVEYYFNKMRSALNENNFYSEESFKRYESDVREEAYNMWKNECKFGEIELINKFESQFLEKIKLSKSELKSTFRKNKNALESRIVKLINNCVEKYNLVMYVLTDTLKTEQIFNSKHEELKTNFVNEFKQKCALNESDYREQQISKLEKAIDDSRTQFYERFLERKLKTRTFYDVSIDELLIKYNKIMKKTFTDDMNISFPEEELKHLHNNAFEDVMSLFGKSFEDEVDLTVIEWYRNTLELKIIKEYEYFKITNEMRNDAIERSNVKQANENLKKFVEDYENRMEEIVQICGSEAKLIEEHTIIMHIIKDEMSKSSPFSNHNLLEPYLTKLEDQLTKLLEDFRRIFKAKAEEHSLVLHEIIKNCRKFYKEEMDKYYSETIFLTSENLIKYNIDVTERAIDKYESDRGNMTYEMFSYLIIDSLQNIYNDIVIENDRNRTSPSIGIHLGTTNSCVAYYQPLKPKGVTIIVPNSFGNRTTPSVVSFGNNNEELIGEEAKDQLYQNSKNTIHSINKLIGRQFNDKTVQKDMLLWPFRVVEDGNNMVKICVCVDGNYKYFFPEEISAKILKYLKNTTENYLECEVRNAVITVPAYFNDAQKEATIDAGKIAGLNVLKIINEPTAAALALQLNKTEDKILRKVLICDLSEETFDVSVVVIEKGVIDVKAVRSDNHLGGDHIDAILVDHCLKQFIQKEQIEFNTYSEEGDIGLRCLRKQCKRGVQQLCITNTALINVDIFYNGKDLNCDLNRQQFEEICNDLFVKSIDLVNQVLSDAHFNHSDIDDIVLVGETTRIPKIQEMLSDLFNGKTLNNSVNPFEAKAIGAAIQAAIISGNITDINKDFTIIQENH